MLTFVFVRISESEVGTLLLDVTDVLSLGMNFIDER